jgi:hypothetical protein
MSLNTTTTLIIPFFGTITVKWDQILQNNTHLGTSIIEHGSLSMENTMAPEFPLRSSRTSEPIPQPDIAYQGVYMQPSSQDGPAIAGGSSSAHIETSYNWQNIGDFDLDQDWNWPS